MIMFFDDDPFFNDDDDQSIIVGNELYKSTKLNDNHYHDSRSKTNSESLFYKPRSSKFPYFNKFPELFDLPDTDSVFVTLIRH